MPKSRSPRNQGHRTTSPRRPVPFHTCPRRSLGSPHPQLVAPAQPPPPGEVCPQPLGARRPFLYLSPDTSGHSAIAHTVLSFGCTWKRLSSLLAACPRVPTLWLGDVASQAWAELVRKVLSSAPLVTRGGVEAARPANPLGGRCCLQDSASLLQNHSQKGKNQRNPGQPHLLRHAAAVPAAVCLPLTGSVKLRLRIK